jgi:hypothetical protein
LRVFALQIASKTQSAKGFMTANQEWPVTTDKGLTGNEYGT